MEDGEGYPMGNCFKSLLNKNIFVNKQRRVYIAWHLPEACHARTGDNAFKSIAYWIPDNRHAFPA